MLRISLQTLRARRGTLAGAFVAIALAVTLAYAAGLLMTSALGSPGPGRYAATDAVVRADPTIQLGHDLGGIDAVPGPRLDASQVDEAAAVPGVARAVGDVSFPVGSGRFGHDWASAALTPYELRSGHAPGPREVVAETGRVGDRIHVATPGGEGTYRVSGIAATRVDADQSALFFDTGTARALAGAGGKVSAIGVFGERGVSAETLRDGLQDALGAEVLAREHAADADPGAPFAESRESVIAVFGTLAGIAGTVALFVVSGTFALAIAQRRRENAVLRALGATPRQVGRLIAGEAFFVSLVATAVGLVAGGPVARVIAGLMADHDVVPAGFEPEFSLVPLAGAAALGIGVAQLAVYAAARRAGRTRPAEALREAAVEHARPSAIQMLSGLLLLGGGVTMALVFAGLSAQSFAILGGMMLAAGAGLLGRVLLGVPAAVLAWPLRRLGAAGLLASTGLAANRWRTAALATPIVLIGMLAGTQGLVQTSDQRHTERVTADRVTAEHVVTGRDGAPLPAGTAERVAGLPGVRTAAAVLPTEVYGLDHGLGEESPWAAAGVSNPSGALDLRPVAGDLGDVRGDGVAVSRVVAHDGGLEVGDAIAVRMADTVKRSLRVVAVYERGAGLGDVVMDTPLARRHAVVGADAAVFVTGGARSLANDAAAHPGLDVLDRDAYLGSVESANQEDAWGVWMIIALAALFAALALVNTAAMATAERRGELATIRLLGGTAGHVIRMVMLEMAATVAVAVAAGGAIVLVATAGVSRGVTGVPLDAPAALLAMLVGGAAALGLAAAVVAARLALRASPIEAMRVA